MRLLFASACLLSLAACGDNEAVPVLPPERDPVAIQALNDQILTDPDLSIHNEANAALTSSTDHSIPPIVATREAIAEAQAEADELLGGVGRMEPLPEAVEEGRPVSVAARIALTGFAREHPFLARCASGMGYTARWAAEWDAALPIYPRANVREAAGNTLGGCDIRAVSFLTPVARDEVAGFYLSRARREGLQTQLRAAGPDLRIELSGQGVIAHLLLASNAHGITRVDMAVQRSR